MTADSGPGADAGRGADSVPATSPGLVASAGLVAPTLDEALALVAAARAHAATLGIAVTCCVVDAGGQPVAFARGDGTALVTVDFALGKAYTAAAWRMRSAELMGIAQPGGPGFGINTVNPRYVLAGGGVPVTRDGVVVGGMGVSGGLSEEDEACALAAVAEVFPTPEG